MDENGVYLEGYGWLTGKSVGEVARPIFDNLREKGYFYQTEIIPACLSALLALWHGTDLPAGERVVHLDA